MTAVDAAPKQPPIATPPQPSWLSALIARMHFYAGLFVGPFIIVAALTGMVYAFAPQIDNAVNRDLVHVDAVTEPLSLQQQVNAAYAYVGQSATVASIKPATSPTDSTRVIFNPSDKNSDASRGVFIHPGNGEVLGEAPLYGRGGSFGLTEWLSTLHKDLHLGDIGVLYSELAASWLWIIALGGVALWWKHRATQSRIVTTRVRRRKLHTTIGLASLVGLLVLAATGITWSEYAGKNVSEVRKTMGWVSSRVDASLPPDSARTSRAVSVDDVVQSARAAGLSSPNLTLTAPARKNGWVVSEDDRVFPLQRDTAVVDPTNATVIGVQRFSDNPVMSKLVTYGILLHRGELFGVINQVALFAIGAGAVALSVIGYLMWWRRRSNAPQRGDWRTAPRWQLAAVVITTITVGLFLPTVGITLVVFLVIDALRSRRTAVATA